MKQAAKYFYPLVLVIATFLIAFMSQIGLDGYVGANSILTAFDELYSIKETYTIINSGSLKEFLLSIIAGNGYIYGRFIYMIDALFAYLPFKLFGLEGLIFAIRCTHAFALLLGFHLLIQYFIKNKGVQTIALLTLLVFPFTIYFMGMPKPEPFQILLLALFIKYQHKNWAYLFLGFALGSKISLIFGLLFFAIVEIKSLLNKAQSISTVAQKGIYFFVALIITIPALPLALINPNFRDGLLKIVSTTHKPYDDPNINLMDWIQMLFSKFFDLPLGLHIIFSSILLAGTLYAFVKQPINRKYMIFGLLVILPVMLLTKRLWGHYLFLGFVLILPILFSALEQLNDKKIKLASLLIAALFIVCNLFPAARLYTTLINRNDTKEFITVKENTLRGIETAKALNCKKIGIHIYLYYTYKWHLNQKDTGETIIYSIAPNELIPVLDFYIEPLDASQKLGDTLFNNSGTLNGVKYYYK